MGISYEELTNNQIMSQKVIDILPMKCKCGSKLVFSESLRRLVCSNPDCTYSLIRKLYRLCMKLNISIRYEDAIEIVKRLKIFSPFQIFYLQDAYDNGLIDNSVIPNIENVITEINAARQVEYKAWQILDMSGEIGAVTKTVGYGFSSVVEMYKEIENGQLSFINERLGIETLDSCIFSIDLYNRLLKIKDEAIFAEQMLNITKYDEPIYIAFNDSAYPYLNKQECIDKLQEMFNKTFVHIGTISDNTDILVKNTTTSSQKYRAAMLINDAYSADLVNNGDIEIQDIGKVRAEELKPIGHKILIGSLEGIIKRLNEVKGVSINNV